MTDPLSLECQACQAKMRLFMYKAVVASFAAGVGVNFLVQFALTGRCF